MNKPATLSLVTPSLNQGEFLEATLRSVLDQQYPALEYVVVDGGSTDGSVELLRRYGDSLSRWVSEADRGHGDALNKGFGWTSGEIMGWLNSSDLHFPWTLRTVAEIFNTLPHVQWIVGVPTVCTVDGVPRSVWNSLTNAYDVLAGTGATIQQESVFWRRSLWTKAGGQIDDGLRSAGDLDLWLRFFRHARLYHVQTILASFRIHEDRLADADGSFYEREAEGLRRRYLAAASRRQRRRIACVRALGPGRSSLAARALGKSGVWPWYRHPRIVFDFTTGQWAAHE